MSARDDRCAVVAGPLGFYARGPRWRVLGPRRDTKDEADDDANLIHDTLLRCPARQHPAAYLAINAMIWRMK